MVRRHRTRARGWAQKLTLDPHLAEDVVQDALLKAFQHIGSLDDAQRFMPWLRRIVRNQALNKLRRGGPHRHEQPFTQLSPPDSPDCADLDAIVHHFARREAAARQGDPETHALRVEFFGMISELLSALSPRQRAVFEAHFFEQLSPQEIADLHGTSTGNVYTVLHRAKAKVQREQLRIYIDASITRRRRNGKMSKQLLARPRLGDNHGTPWHSFAGACYAVLNGLGRPVTTADVMGMSGLAFRLNIDEGQIHVAAPSGFDWTRTAHDTLRNLGYEATTMGEPNHVSPTAEELAEAIDFVRRSIDAGRSVLAWDLFCGEFGVIYGYDDAAKHFHAVDCSTGRDPDPTLPYEKLGRGDCTELFLAAIKREVAIDPVTTLRNALETAVTQARVPESFSDDVLDIRMVNGLAGYDAWIRAFERGAVDPFGNAYNTAVYRDSRNYAVRFLRRVVGAETDANDGASRASLGPEARGLIADAADHYAIVAAALGEMAELFPFPKGGQPNDADQAAQAAAALRRAKASEQEAVAVLAQIVDLLANAVSPL